MSKNLSAIKKVKITLRNRLKNKTYKLAVKKSIKAYLLNVNVENQELDKVFSNLSMVYQNIDKAVKYGILHKNTAARKKARLLKKIKHK